MDKPDAVITCDFPIPCEEMELWRVNAGILAFKKSEQKEKHYWYLSFHSWDDKDPMHDPLKGYVDMEINRVKKVEFSYARQLWKDLLEDGWERATQDEIDGIDGAGTDSYLDYAFLPSLSGGFLLAPSANASLPYNNSISINTSSFNTSTKAAICIEADGTFEITGDDGTAKQIHLPSVYDDTMSNRCDIQTLQVEIDILRKRVEQLEKEKEE